MRYRSDLIWIFFFGDDESRSFFYTTIYGFMSKTRSQFALLDSRFHRQEDYRIKICYTGIAHADVCTKRQVSFVSLIQRLSRWIWALGSFPPGSIFANATYQLLKINTSTTKYEKTFNIVISFFHWYSKNKKYISPINRKKCVSFSVEPLIIFLKIYCNIHKN